MILETALSPSTAPRRAPRFCATVAQTWRTVKKDLFDPYRPELHYMRGTGPKSGAKKARMAHAGTVN